MQVTACLAIISIVLVEYMAFKSKGFIGRLKEFTKPIWIITPINIMEVITKPLSLCMRLFGNRFIHYYGAYQSMCSDILADGIQSLF